jgi:predicted ATPase/class 3 adenylate cyclase
MRQLPSGTVTLLFTDIEGSTRMLHELGRERYVRALTEHRTLLRETFCAHGGVEVEMQGDSFHFAFPFARDAVAAAAAGQRALAEHAWEAEPIRVRIGLDTGEPMQADGLYAGLDVHRAARVMSAGHGGQVLLSERTARIVDGELPDGVVLRDLGRHALKDFSDPQRLFQLSVPGLPDVFPALKTQRRRLSNLPARPTPLVGRSHELTEVTELLREARLVTLTGAGGSGKTRLALEAAAELMDDFEDGAWWVSLAAIREPELVEPTIAQVLGVKEELVEHLREWQALLLLDNFEQVIEAAPVVAGLLAAAPGVRILVTSRERLAVSAEHEYAVPTLELADAVELFTARARQVEPGFEPDDDVAEIAELCARLDNLPLTVELAAARTRALTPGQILDRLSQRLDLLKGGRDVDPRHVTLRATIASSYDLLSPGEQRVFARLSVFVGGCTLEAAEVVGEADVDTLQSLVEKSLLRFSNGRYWMFETIRDYAAGELEALGDEKNARRRHAQWMVEWSMEFDVRRGDQAASLSTLRQELPNVRAAVEELGASGHPCERLHVVTSLAQGMFQLGLTRESGQWLEGGLSAGEACPPELRARALAYASIQLSLTGDAERGAAYVTEAADLVSRESITVLQAEVRLAASVAQLELGNLEEAELLAREALAHAQERGDADLVGDLRNNLAYISMLTGNLELARGTLEVAVGEARKRADYHLTAVLLHNLAVIAIRNGALERATGHLEEALRIARRYEFDDVVQFGVDGVAAIAVRTGECELAAQLLGATSSRHGLMGRMEADLRRDTEENARAVLGQSAFETFCASGAGLGLDAAAARAARWIDSVRPRRPASETGP